MCKDDEQILCVPVGKLAPYSHLEGFSFWSSTLSEQVTRIVEDCGVYLRRGDVETNPAWKQIIPQVCLLAENQIAVHVIPNTAGEKRLHGRASIFYGGHMEERDDKSIIAAAMRELREETAYAYPYILSSVGFVNLNDTMLNQVHFGIVMVASGGKAKMSVCSDKGVTNSKFLDWKEAGEKGAQMNSWSRMAFPMLMERSALT